MQDSDFERLSSDPLARQANYKLLATEYYNRVTGMYRRAWSDSFHFALFTGAETLAEALLATEHRIAREGGFRPGMKVLDIGCGVGGPALNIAAFSGAHVTGVNIAEDQLKIARQRAAGHGLSDRVRFQLADAMHLPFASGSFDAIYMLDAGCHMPDKANFHFECARVLRAGGVFLGDEWLRRDGLTAAEEARFIEPICRYHGVPHLASLSETGAYLAAAGFQVEVLEDLAVRGNVLRNWEILDEHTIRNLRATPRWLMPKVLRMLTDGGIALAEAARAGAFLIGYWRARKAEA